MNVVTQAVAVIPSGVFTLLAALLAILGAFAVQRFIDKRKASAGFRASVQSAIAALPPDRSVVAQLPVAIGALESAVNAFAPYLRGASRRSFEDEWRKLKAHCEHQMPGAMSLERILYDHPTSMNEGMRPKEAIRRFHSHIKALLSYAQDA